MSVFPIISFTTIVNINNAANKRKITTFELKTTKKYLLKPDIKLLTTFITIVFEICIFAASILIDG